MTMRSLVMGGFALLFSQATFAADAALPEGPQVSLQRYQAEAGQPFDAARGKALWEKEVNGKSCASCHHKDVTQPGEVGFWIFTKEIAPMALSANPKLFEDPDHTEKLFNKRCDSVFSRECTALEKGDIMLYLTSQ
jgi:hypothetical protein